ncbi:MAG: CPBP family intramembrane metalloprotease [Propionibacteriaceae bacterium]|jgi:membrane protease YdiL (CAAX protease family)|nr:CPBP family intramembrane metalloprotease [Propionibacteriaceae bacterium]
MSLARLVFTSLPRLFTDPAAGLRDDDLLPPDQPLKPWPNPHRFRANAAVRGLAFLASAMVLYAAGDAVYYAVTAQTPSSFLARSGLEVGAAIASYLIVASLTEQRQPPFELAPRRWVWLFGGLAFGAAAIALTVGLLALAGAYKVTGFDPSYSPWADLVSAGLVAAICEELIFRGMVFRLLEDALGSWLAVALVSAAFGAIHLANPEGTVLGAVGVAVEGGIVTTAVYILSRSLWWCVGEHFAWNIVQGPVFGSAISGSGEPRGWIVAEMSGPDWLTGGAFGVEASAVTAFWLASFGAVLLVAAHKSGRIVSPCWTRRKLLAATGPAVAS